MESEFNRSVERSVKFRYGCRLYLCSAILTITACVVAIIVIESLEFLEASDIPVTSDWTTASTPAAVLPDAGWDPLGGPVGDPLPSITTIQPRGELPPTTTASPPNTLNTIFGSHTAVGWLVATIVFVGIIMVISAVCVARGHCHHSKWFHQHCLARGDVTVSRVSLDLRHLRAPNQTDSPASRSMRTNLGYYDNSPARSIYMDSCEPSPSLPREEESRISVISVEPPLIPRTSNPPPYIVAIRLPTPGTTPDDSPGFLAEPEPDSLSLPTYDDAIASSENLEQDMTQHTYL